MLTFIRNLKRSLSESVFRCAFKVIEKVQKSNKKKYIILALWQLPPLTKRQHSEIIIEVLLESLCITRFRWYMTWHMTWHMTWKSISCFKKVYQSAFAFGKLRYFVFCHILCEKYKRRCDFVWFCKQTLRLTESLWVSLDVCVGAFSSQLCVCVCVYVSIFCVDVLVCVRAY